MTARQPFILALEGALGPLSLVASDGVRTFTRVAAGNDALERGLRLVDEVLLEAAVALPELAALACTLGPGGFTGLRITLACAKGLAFALGIPLIGCSSFDVVRELLAAAPAGDVLIALRPRPGILSLQLQTAQGAVVAQATGLAAESTAAIRAAITAPPALAAYPPEAARLELAAAGLELAARPATAALPAEALAVLARRRLATASADPATIHALRADYGEAPAAICGK